VLTAAACAPSQHWPAVAITRPPASVQATLPAQSTVPTVSAAVPDWVVRDAALLRADPSAFGQAAASAVAAGDPEEPESFVTLTRSLAHASSNGAVWRIFPDSDTTICCVFFDNSPTNYPCADGLIYSTSPTRAPAPESVLTTPVAVAPHWWAAAWDPVLFDAFGYGNPDADARSTDAIHLVRASRLPSPSATVSGTIVCQSESSQAGDLFEFVDVGGTKPVPVILNGYTKLHWPSTWGRVVNSGGVAGGVALPVHTPDSMVGVHLTAQVRTTVLPDERKQGFALDARFADR
jgi:hypothetical protein